MNEDINSKSETNVNHGGQVIVANDDATVIVSQNNRNKEGDAEKNRKFREIRKRISKKVVVVATVVAIVVLSLMLFVRYYFNVKFSYNNYTNIANYAQIDHDYIKAAENYHKASGEAEKLIFGKELYVESACMEADSYLLMALSMSKKKKDDIAKQYYIRAGRIYGEIINNKENKDTDSYVDALVGLSYVYNYTGHIIDRQWAEVISLIGEETKKIPTIDLSISDNSDIDDTLLKRWIKIYSAIFDFLYKMMANDYSLMYNSNTLNMALMCNNNYSALVELAGKRNIEIEMVIKPIYMDFVKTRLLIALARSSSTEDPKQLVEEAIDICQSYLKDTLINIGDDVETYVNFKYNVADGYLVLGLIYREEDQKSKEYMKKAYDELMSLLDLKSDKMKLEQKIQSGYLAIFTGFCSNDDLKKIINNYHELVLKYSAGENPQKTAFYALNICDGCMNIIETYGYSQEAWELGQYITEEVKRIEEYVQPSQKDVFDGFYNYFHENVDEVKEQFPYDMNNTDQ